MSTPSINPAISNNYNSSDLARKLTEEPNIDNSPAQQPIQKEIKDDTYEKSPQPDNLNSTNPQAIGLNPAQAMRVGGKIINVKGAIAAIVVAVAGLFLHNRRKSADIMSVTTVAQLSKYMKEVMTNPINPPIKQVTVLLKNGDNKEEAVKDFVNITKAFINQKPGNEIPVFHFVLKEGTLAKVEEEILASLNDGKNVPVEDIERLDLTTKSYNFIDRSIDHYIHRNKYPIKVKVGRPNFVNTKDNKLSLIWKAITAKD